MIDGNSAAERAHNETEARLELGYQREQCLDAQADFARANPLECAKFTKEYGDPVDVITKFLVLAKQAESFSGMTGPIHDDYRRKLVYDLSQLGREVWGGYAEGTA